MKLEFPNKVIRADIIRQYCEDAASYAGVVCFSCGNASKALKDAGMYVVDIAPNGGLQAGKWWTPAEIKKSWPLLFDATSGHLPMPLMVTLGEAFKEFLGMLPLTEYDVPTGSGETITCLRFAYPDVKFNAVYNLDNATEYNEEAPLNSVVRAMSNGNMG